jgi:hypothetical protein
MRRRFASSSAAEPYFDNCRASSIKRSSTAPRVSASASALTMALRCRWILMTADATAPQRFSAKMLRSASTSRLSQMSSRLRRDYQATALALNLNYNDARRNINSELPQ